jgi:triosephosphate isomerase
VGETSEDLEKHGPSAVPVAQLRTAIAGAERGKELVIAYEPVWAIGSGQPASSAQAQVVCAALRAALADELGDEVASTTRILYGGSVKSANIAGFMREQDIDGALVGGASLVLEEFASIVRYQHHVGT